MQSRNKREGEYLGHKAFVEGAKPKHWRVGARMAAQGYRAYKLKITLCVDGKMFVR